MKSNIITLQDALQAMIQLHIEYAELLTLVTGYINTPTANSPSESGWTFRENDYATLATWLTHDPSVVQLGKQKWSGESWPKYAIRLSKYVGWAVDSLSLRRAIERQQNPKK